jgi:hypothetical protein
MYHRIVDNGRGRQTDKTEELTHKTEELTHKTATHSSERLGDILSVQICKGVRGVYVGGGVSLRLCVYAHVYVCVYVCPCVYVCARVRACARAQSCPTRVRTADSLQQQRGLGLMVAGLGCRV